MSNISKFTYFNKTANNLSFDHNLMTMIYLPIIGNNAFCLYSVLINEAKLVKIVNNEIKKLDNLIKLLGINFEEFHKIRECLEAVGLLKTYLYEENNTQNFCFELKKPLLFNEFISNSKLKNLLISKTSEYYFNELMINFSAPKIESNFIDISKTINDYFDDFNGTEFSFDFDELYKNITSMTKNYIFVSFEVKKTIDFFYKLYNLELFQIEHAIFKSLVPDEDNSKFIVDNVLLESELYNLVSNSARVNYFEILDIYRDKTFFINYASEDVKTQKFIEYKHLKPEQFLVSLQKHQLDHNDFSIINVLKRDFYLSNQLINIIIDFSVTRTHGKLNISYLKKVAHTVNSLGLSTVNDCYDYFLGLSKFSHISKTNNIQKNKKNDEIELIDINLLDLESS